MQTFGLHYLALEWDQDLTVMITAFLDDGTLTDQPRRWSGDGWITAGHLALLRERAGAGTLHWSCSTGR